MLIDLGSNFYCLFLPSMTTFSLLTFVYHLLPAQADMCLFRYLRARDWKYEKAEKMLQATMDWRREWHVEDIRKEDVILTLVRFNTHFTMEGDH